MSLKALTFPKVTVETLGGNFTLRGLTAPDVFAIVQEFDSEIMAIAAASTSNSADVMEIGRSVITSAPKLAAAVIAAAADEPDSAPLVEMLPFGVQLHALEKVGELTFAMEGGFENFLKTVKRAVAAMQKLPLAAKP